MPNHVLIIDDERELAASLAEYLETFDYQTSVLAEPEEWESLVRANSFDLILLDIRMPKMSGFDLLAGIRAKNWDTPVIMISGFASVENIVKAMRFGATNFYQKPLRLENLVKEIDRILKTRMLRQQPAPTTPIITEDRRMREVIRVVEKSADTNASVVITGESGTGKELIARSFHFTSSRRDKELITLNCAAIPDNLLESELFGYEAGAFTDAKSRKIGKFEQAHGGTMFFDELCELSMSIQAKLLRVLQDGRFERLGGSSSIYSDVRVIGATNRDIREAVRNGEFREDLFYRLAVVMIEVPPLRERRDDILPLARHFVKHYATAYSRSVTSLGNDVIDTFLAHDWLGNVRELKNAIERAVIFCEGETIHLEHLPVQYRSEMADYGLLPRLQDSISRQMIVDALERAGGVKQKAAEMLNVHRKTLYNRMKRLGIKE